MRPVRWPPDPRRPPRTWCECGLALPRAAFQGRRAALGGTDNLEPRGGPEVSRGVSRQTRRQTPGLSGLSYLPCVFFYLRKEAWSLAAGPPRTECLWCLLA